jgi:hypothetical protein
MAGRIFIKFVVGVMTFETFLKSYFLIGNTNRKDAISREVGR